MTSDHLMATWAPNLLEALANRAHRPDRQESVQAPDAIEEILEDDDDTEDEADEQQTGVMVAFFPTPEQQTTLAVPGGEEPEELHLTLAYLGKVGQEVHPDSEALIIQHVSQWAASIAPVHATLAGIGVFTADVVPVTYASVDSPALAGIRQDLLTHLEAAGTPAVATHGYTPHITLAYDDRRDIAVPSLDLLFSEVVVAFAGQQTRIPLSGPPLPAPRPQTSAAFTPASGITLTDRPSAPTDMSITPSAPVQPEGAKAFVTELNGHTLISGPATAIRASLREPTVEDITDEHMLWIHGKFVGAEVPNRNGALWSAGDLQMSKGSVVNGPLNWLHEGRHIIGSLAGADYVDGRAKAHENPIVPGPVGYTQPHLTATAGIWKWIYPDEAFVVNQASELGQLWYSMECISAEVSCAGPSGCGNTTSYSAYLAGAACEHITQRASVRQFVKPVFLGGAVIVPPTRPGWAEADASVMSQATQLAEAAFDQAGEPDIAASTWEQMMAQLIRFAGQ